MSFRLRKITGSAGGFALVIVIVIMLLVSFLAGQLILNVSTELKIAHNKKKREKELSLAQAGLNLAIFRLLDTPLQDLGHEWDSFLQGRKYEAYLPNGRAAYFVVNESGKIDLNHFDREFLDLFLKYMEVEAEDREVIVDSLLDWQDKDDLHRLNGAEQDYYAGLRDPYIPRNGNLMDPEEFFLVRGAEKLAGRFRARDIFTVHNRRQKVDFNNLTPVMLDFFVEGDSLKKKAYIETRHMQGALGAPQARRILGDARYEQLAPFLTYSSASRYYSIISRGEAGITEDGDQHYSGAAMEIYVLIRKRGGRIKYFAWDEGLS
ncbi:MAG: type II secretion system protein GspK [Desulfobia sp.]